MGGDAMGGDAMRDAAMGEWALLGAWQASPAPLVGVDLAVLRERLRLVGRARASLAAFEADLVGEITRQEGEAKAEEILRRDQKRSLASARKAVKVAAQLEWMPGVAEKLAEGAITAEAASLIAEAAAEAPVDQNFLQLACHPNTTTTGGRPPDAELVVLADYDAVHDKLVNAGLVDGTRLTEAETLAIACDASILPGIFNKHTGNIILGQTRRKVSRRLRKRLTVRDRGCIGCGAPDKICEVHHIEHWENGGPTTYDNTCLLCWRCHHIRVHHHGEQVTRHPNGHYTLQPPTHTPPRAGPPHPPHTEQASRHANGHHTPQPPIDAPTRAGPPTATGGERASRHANGHHTPQRSRSAVSEECAELPAADTDESSLPRNPAPDQLRVGLFAAMTVAGTPQPHPPRDNVPDLPQECAE